MRDPAYSASEKFLLFPILAAILNLVEIENVSYEWLYSLYVRLQNVPSGDALRRIGAILIVSKTSNVKISVGNHVLQMFCKCQI